MKKLLNTLYVTTEDSYLSLDGENVVLYSNKVLLGRVPLHNIDSIIVFNYQGTSPALMGACIERNISLCYVSPSGKFLARITGKMNGNVLLRKKQYEISCDESKSLSIAKNFIIGKVYNSKWVLERAIRDHSLQVDIDKVKKVSQFLSNSLINIRKCESLDELRGYEGEAAKMYFSVFDELILQQKDYFVFNGRNKRPPMDAVNCLLSFMYTLLTNTVITSLECVGLDSYVGFMHTDRPGRASLALDMVEELRSVLVDRFVLTIINKKIVTEKDFIVKENGAVLISDDARKKILSEWQKKKQDTIKHPFLEEKIEWGMVPYIQSTLLARYLRDDLDEYPSFLWK